MNSKTRNLIVSVLVSSFLLVLMPASPAQAWIPEGNYNSDPYAEMALIAEAVELVEAERAETLPAATPKPKPIPDPEPLPPARSYEFSGACTDEARCDENRELGYELLLDAGWDDQQFSCLDPMWNHESGWDNYAASRWSSAYGIAQFLDSTWGDYGYTKTDNAEMQIIAGLDYIENRYGNPCSAWGFWQATVYGDSSLAPSDLQDAARYWIARDFKGY